MDAQLPCIVGVAQKTWRPEDGDAPHPLLQCTEVCRQAVADCGQPGISGYIDELDVVRNLSWHYDDLPAAMADALGLAPGERKHSGMSGTSPQRFITDAAESILRGERRAVLITGAEALATRKRAHKTGRQLDWPRAHSKPQYPFEDPPHPGELSHGLTQAYATFAILDSARRAQLGLTPEDNRRQQAAMMAGLSTRAAVNPLAWFRKAHSATSLFEMSDHNRMVASPFSKNTMAFMDVDMAAAILITSHGVADQLGIPPQRRVYPQGWGHAKAPPHIAARAELFQSPAMRFACDQAFSMAGRQVSDIDFLDIYSCFASNINFTRDILGLAGQDPRALTVTGGLPYFGGPGNNYCTHAIASMVEQLRDAPGSSGLVTAVGMHMTNHSFAIYSSVPQPISLTASAPYQPQCVAIAADAGGPAVIRGYTVLHGKTGRHALAVCELDSGARCYARCDDPGAIEAMDSEEWVGRGVTLRSDGGVNSFSG